MLSDKNTNDEKQYLGAIAGDIISSVDKFNNYRSEDFPLFSDRATLTDDSLMTIAVADSLVNNLDMASRLKQDCRKYPNRGYGGMFYRCLASVDNDSYNSYGNGSARKV